MSQHWEVEIGQNTSEFQCCKNNLKSYLSKIIVLKYSFKVIHTSNTWVSDIKHIHVYIYLHVNAVYIYI